MQSVRLVLICAGALAACGPVPNADGPKSAPVDARIVAAERGRGGVHLVLVDESGARLAEVTAPFDEVQRFVVDAHPAWSPDGKWIAFASNRGTRGTGLWVVAAEADVEPRALALPGEAVVDRDPVWSPDGKWIVFASNRAGGSFDLWRVGVGAGDDGWPTVTSQPEQLTRDDADIVSPDWAPDGKALAYARFDRAGKTSTIWTSDPRGRAAKQLTQGPLDQTPAWSPNSQWIAYSAPASERNDFDIYVVKRNGTRERRIIDEPLAHETEPAWSFDGKHLFATAVLRNEETGNPFFWSIVFVEVSESSRVHALHDPAAVARVGFALAPHPLRRDTLATAPAYDRDTVLGALRDLCAELPADELPEACKALRGEGGRESEGE